MNKRHRGLLDWPVVATRLSQDVISMEATQKNCHDLGRSGLNWSVGMEIG